MSSQSYETFSQAVILPTTSHASGLSQLDSPTLAGRCERRRSPSFGLAFRKRRERLRERFASVDAATLDEALSGLASLVPSDGDADTVPVTVLIANRDSVEVRAARASAVLDEIQAAGNLARVVVSGLVAEPITSEEELEVALGRIRDAVSAELAAGKQVRIQ